MLRLFILFIFLSSCFEADQTPEDYMVVGEWYGVTCLDDIDSFFVALEARSVVNQEASKLGLLKNSMDSQTQFNFCSLAEPFHCSYIPHKVVECAFYPRTVYVSRTGYPEELYDQRPHIALGVINHMWRMEDLDFGCTEHSTWPANEECLYQNKKYESLISKVWERMKQ